MTPPPDDDDEPEYPPPQFIAQSTPAKPSKRTKTPPPVAPAAPKPEPVAAVPEPPPPRPEPIRPIPATTSPEPSGPNPTGLEPTPTEPATTEPTWFERSPPESDADPTIPPVDDMWTTSAGTSQPVPAPTPVPAAATASGPLFPTVVVSEWSSPPSKPVPASPPAPEPEPPLLPATYSENDLRTAIGAPAMPERIKPPRHTPPPDLDEDADDDGDDRPRSRKTILVVTGSVVLGAAIATAVLLGRLNSERYLIGCRAKEAVAEQGRSFPPWGTSRLGGDEWKPIAIPPSFQCVELETDDVGALHDAFRKMLVDRADAMLTAREVTEVDAAAGMLEQALLHARSDRKSDADARKDIQRMLGDVGYWRASAQLRKASGELADAAKQFETASAQLPRHVSDASAWAAYIHRLVDELKAGPSGSSEAAFPPVPPTERPRAPPGEALPVEPDAGVAAEPPPTPPDAPPQTGGVLL